MSVAVVVIVTVAPDTADPLQPQRRGDHQQTCHDRRHGGYSALPGSQDVPLAGEPHEETGVDAGRNGACAGGGHRQGSGACGHERVDGALTDTFADAEAQKNNARARIASVAGRTTPLEHCALRCRPRGRRAPNPPLH